VDTKPTMMMMMMINSPWSVTPECIALATETVHGTWWSQILVPNCNFCLPPPALDAPIRGGFLSEYCHDVWYEKNRMVWLSDGEKIMTIWLFWQNSRMRQRTETHTNTKWWH